MAPKIPSYKDYKDSKHRFRLKMRELEHTQEQDFFREVEHNSEIDQNKFWYLVNSSRKRKCRYDEPLHVEGEVYRSTTEKLLVWENYFSSLYVCHWPS